MGRYFKQNYSNGYIITAVIQLQLLVKWRRGFVKIAQSKGCRSSQEELGRSEHFPEEVTFNLSSKAKHGGGERWVNEVGRGSLG